MYLKKQNKMVNEINTWQWTMLTNWKNASIGTNLHSTHACSDANSFIVHILFSSLFYIFCVGLLHPDFLFYLFLQILFYFTTAAIFFSWCEIFYLTPLFSFIFPRVIIRVRFFSHFCWFGVWDFGVGGLELGFWGQGCQLMMFWACGGRPSGVFGVGALYKYIIMTLGKTFVCRCVRVSLSAICI